MYYKRFSKQEFGIKKNHNQPVLSVITGSITEDAFYKLF